jgi:hypothetical protein
MSPGLLKKSRKVQDENEDKANSLQAVPVIDATGEKFVAEETSLSVLEAIKEEERQLAAEKRQLTETLEQLQLKSDAIADRKSHLLEEMEKNVSFKQQKNDKEPVLQLFQIETGGSSFNDGLVFTVTAEDNVWAEGLVREWLQCYGKETDKVDKIRAVVSRDVRAIINVGTKLLTA